MSRSKGPRLEVKVRLPVHVVEALRRERDARHLAQTLRPDDGIPTLIEEAVALRHDRDAELARISAHAIQVEAERDAALRLAKAAQRDARRAKAARRVRGAAQGVLPGPRTAAEALLRDHGLPPPQGHARGALPGLCPACGPVATPGTSTGSQGGPPSS